MDPNKEVQEMMKRSYRAAVIVGVSITLMLVFYAGAVEVIRATQKPFQGFGALPASALLTFRYVIYGLGVVAIIAIRFLQQFLLKPAPMDDDKTTVGKLSRTAITTLALSEIPAVLGLFLFIASGLYRDFYILLFVSLFLLFMYFPRLRSWEDWLQKHRHPTIP
jgi:hypothetical protein